ncbi:MAG: winged helix DNA-binding domain-containing protein [Dysgonamonadaceae bacterium]|jgi:hypothetical protein|nr:winged helix DNA-binding domain-containing protein [Dysgonamonadaceae bacterium]
MNTVTRIRLASHLLSGTHCQTPEGVVAWMGAMQSQDYNAAKMAINIRLQNCTEQIVETTFNQGKILRTHVLRPTWHFVSPENIRWMLSLSAARIKSSAFSRDRDLEINEELYSRTNNIIQKILEGGKHLTREVIGIELEKCSINVNSARLVHFLMRAEVEGIVCSGALQGKNQTYALLDERAPSVPALHKEEALTKLSRLYFQSHSPATLQDFVWWSGLSQTEANLGLNNIKHELISEKIENQTYWFLESYKNIPDIKNSCLLLPAFDEYIIAYRDRSPILLPEHQSKAISSNGIFRPVILVNGQVVGLWKKTSQKKTPLIFDFFETEGIDLIKKIMHLSL